MDMDTVSAKVHELYSDGTVKTRKGIFEYILGGCIDTKLLEIRIFEEPTKKAVYGWTVIDCYDSVYCSGMHEPKER